MKLSVFLLLNLLLYPTVFYTSSYKSYPDETKNALVQIQDSRQTLPPSAAAASTSNDDLTEMPETHTVPIPDRSLTFGLLQSNNDNIQSTNSSAATTSAQNTTLINSKTCSRIKTDQPIRLSNGVLAIPIGIYQEPEKETIQIVRQKHFTDLPPKARTYMGVAAGLYAFTALFNAFFLFYDFKHDAESNEQYTTMSPNDTSTTTAPYPANEPALLKWFNLCTLVPATVCLIKGYRESSPAEREDRSTQSSEQTDNDK